MGCQGFYTPTFAVRPLHHNELSWSGRTPSRSLVWEPIMARCRPPIAFPLPDGWPKRVRSGIVHAICLARVALTAAHGWAANSSNARMRLGVENQRLRQEVHQLREELRIKDARMLRVPAI